jgi:hypothetical protein
MTLRLKLLLVAALSCALLAPTPQSASAAEGMEVAVQDDSSFVTELPRPGYRLKALKLATGLNASWIRANVQWNYVVGRAAKKRTAPKRIDYNWTGYDLLVEAAAARGINVQLALTGPAPAWATANHKVGPLEPKAAPFKVFARDAAEHFKGRVTRYSIWNEPNYVSWISPLESAARVYRGLYVAGYSAIKNIDRDAQVLIAETSPYAIKRRATAPLEFLRDVTCANAQYRKARSCGTLKTDGFAHHPYDFRHAPTYKYPGKDNVTLATLGRLESALFRLKQAKLLTTPTGGEPDLYLTEYGYFSSGKYGLSSSKQGQYLVRAFDLAQKDPRVQQMLQYVLIQPSSKYRFFDTSIASRKGAPRTAFKKLAAWAKRAVAAGEIAAATAPGSGSDGTGSGADNGGSGGTPPSDTNPPPSCAPLPVCPP